MFEDSLVESQGRLGSPLSSGARRWITAGSLGVQSCILTLLVVVPLLRPEKLPFRMLAPGVVVPLKKAPAVVPQRQAVSRAAAAAAPLSNIAADTRRAILPSLHPAAPSDPEMATGPAVPANLSGMGGPGSVGNSLEGDTGGSRVAVVQAKRAEPLRISAGVSSGMLLGEIRPVYPRIAVAARVEGVVVIAATISKTGAIESARVVSGPAMLQSAAIEAVRAARYRPYRLNGEATEVETSVTVNFRLGS